MKSNQYFNNSILLENTLLPYFCEAEPLKFVNKIFSKLNYEKYNIDIQPHGIVETYNSKTKLIEERKTYKNGKLHGLYEYYYENGQLLEKCYYVNEKQEGLYEKWYNNGELKIKYNCKNGILNGLYQSWNFNGTSEFSGIYKNGKFNDKNGCVIL